MAKVFADDEVTVDAPSSDGGIALRAADIGLKDQYTPLGAKKGGNIDLTTRPDTANPDGSHSSVRSMSFQAKRNGPEISVPTIADDGRQMTEDEAIRQYERTGKNFGKFKTIKEANKFGELLHRQQAGELNARPALTSPNPKTFADTDVTPDPPKATATPEPGIGTRALNVVKAIPGALVDTAKSFARAVPTAIDLASPISKSGGLQVPFGQLADGSYRREMERGVGNAVTFGLANKAANKLSPDFAASEKTDQAKAPEARNLGEVAGSFSPGVLNNVAVDKAVKFVGKGLGKIGEKIGSTARSDRRLVDDITDGARGKLRTKLEKTEAKTNADLVRSNPELLKSRKDPARFQAATAEHLAKNRAGANAIGAPVSAKTSELVEALRKKQESFRKDLDTEELADAMEAPIKLLERRAERLAKGGPDMPPSPAPAKSVRDDAAPRGFDDADDLSGAVAPTPAERAAFQAEMRKAHGGDIKGVTDAPVDGVRTATSEEATKVAGKAIPTPPPAGIPKAEGDAAYRNIRQYVTNRQEKAFDYMPGAKPSVENKAHQAVADTVKEILHGKVGAISPESLPALKQLDADSSILARMNKIAEYKKVNAPANYWARMTTAMKNNRGAFATAKAVAKLPFRTADEALASIARAAQGGNVPKSMLEKARNAGVSAATINMLTTKLGDRIRDDETE